MNYLKRKADAFLKDWKKDLNHYPLIVKGARQIGKTMTIRKFAEDNYSHVIEINFALEPTYRSITEGGYSASEIIKSISRIDPRKKFVPGKTLLFFDEIQDYPDIATALKSFYEDGQYDVICSGSLLGIQYKRIHSISVGYKTDYLMYSMDFEEFLWAKGYDDEFIEYLLEHMVKGSPFTAAEHEILSNLFLEYCILGGMPQIVANYIELDRFEGSLELQKQLLLGYEGDARKYSEGLDQSRIISVFRSVPAQLAKENKKFQYGRITKGGRAKDYLGCIQWLEDAGIVNICRCLGFPELPLKGNVDWNKFKLYMADTGLLVASLDDEAQMDLRANRNLGVYKGALFENFAAEALVKQGYGLYYYKKENSTLEQDFFVRSVNELIPLEIKASNNKSKSLMQLIRSEHYPDITRGIKFSSSNIGVEDPIYTFPHYCLFLLKRYMEEENRK